MYMYILQTGLSQRAASIREWILRGLIYKHVRRWNIRVKSSGRVHRNRIIYDMRADGRVRWLLIVMSEKFARKFTFKSVLLSTQTVKSIFRSVRRRV